jgi:protein ImuB
MRRVVSVWLPQWPIERMRRGAPQAAPQDRPCALVASGSRGLRLTAVNARAAAGGLWAGQALADARAILPTLVSHPAEPDRDRAALLTLARWCGRYGPARNAEIAEVGPEEGPADHGLWIDVTGVAHLFGGEGALLEDLCRRFMSLGITPRAGLADTLGAAHALARFGVPTGRAWRIAPAGTLREALAPLPVEALRLAPETVLLLKRLGLRRIGALYGVPRAALARRFREAAGARAKRPAAEQASARAGTVLARLDQALGVSAEPLRPLAEPPTLAVRRAWPAPLVSAEALLAELPALAASLVDGLAGHGLALRRARLVLYRADGTVAEARVGTSLPCRAGAHLVRLLADKLDRLDAGFGVDVMELAATAVERRATRQEGLAAGLAGAHEGDAGELVDLLANRLGAGNVWRLAPRDSHIPERAETRVAALAGALPRGQRATPVWSARALPPRPPLLLARPEPITVTAEVPDGPPARFRWRRLERRVARAEGPERVAPEWWREPAGPCARPRDYFRIEDEAGGRYWVFRDGLYGGEGEPPRWFLHGLFG